MRVQQLIEDDLNKRSVKHANKSTLVARGADTQLGSRSMLTSNHLPNQLEQMKNCFSCFLSNQSCSISARGLPQIHVSR